MLFVIDQSVAEVFPPGGPNPLDVESLNFLALAAAEGSHRIIGPRRLLYTLAGSGELSLRARKVFERAAGRVAQEGNLQYELSAYGRIVAGAGANPVSASVGMQRVITFPLRWFDHTAKIQPTILLGENLSDTYVFQKIGEAGTVIANLPYLPLSIAHDHGGGDTTALVLNLNASANRPCVCIVDSDRACPTGTRGATATKVQPLNNPAKYPLLEVCETTGRDLENSLPDIFYRNTFGAQVHHATLVGLLESLTRTGEIDTRAHLDIENGLTLRQFFSHPLGSPENIFWHAKLRVIAALLGISLVGLPCFAAGVCAQAQGTPCGCVIVAGIPANVLNQFRDRWQSATRYQLASCLDNSVRSAWRELGVKITSWCCGDDRLRV